MISTDKIIIHRFRTIMQAGISTIEVLCQIPSISAMGLSIPYTILFFPQEQYLSTSDCSTEELRIAVSTFTQISVDNIKFFTELSDVEKSFLDAQPKHFSYSTNNVTSRLSN